MTPFTATDLSNRVRARPDVLPFVARCATPELMLDTLQRLEVLGYVEHDGEGRWTVTPAGARLGAAIDAWFDDIGGEKAAA